MYYLWVQKICLRIVYWNKASLILSNFLTFAVSHNRSNVVFEFDHIKAKAVSSSCTCGIELSKKTIDSVDFSEYHIKSLRTILGAFILGLSVWWESNEYIGTSWLVSPPVPTTSSACSSMATGLNVCACATFKKMAGVKITITKGLNKYHCA